MRQYNVCGSVLPCSTAPAPQLPACTVSDAPLAAHPHAAHTGAQPGTEIVQAGGGAAGVLLAAEGTLGLAHLKLAPALAAAAGGGAPLHFAGDAGGRVAPARPAWWPAEWGHEEEAAGSGKQ